MYMKRRGRLAEEQPLADINVTPFVDVVLVLLIIFMITAAVVEFGMRVGTPRTTNVTAEQPQKPNIVSISSKGQVYYDGDPVNIYTIAERAKTAQPAKPTVYLRIHKLAAYDIVAQVLAECKAQDVTVNLVAKPLTREPR